MCMCYVGMEKELVSSDYLVSWGISESFTQVLGQYLVMNIHNACKLLVAMLVVLNYTASFKIPKIWECFYNCGDRWW